jgi:hypothetical protein
MRANIMMCVPKKMPPPLFVEGGLFHLALIESAWSVGCSAPPQCLPIRDNGISAQPPPCGVFNDFGRAKINNHNTSNRQQERH